jgi:hypothetical protein
MGARRGILLSRGDIENLLSLIGEALDVIDQYYSGDDPDLSGDPEYALELIRRRLEEIGEILESWLLKLEEEHDK